MYYVNVEQIDSRLAVIPVLSEASSRLAGDWKADKPDLLHGLAQERVLHLAIELVTDVGSLLIDGFLMRDASSYEDIIDILRGEGVFDSEASELLLNLVRMRRDLVQQYMSLDRNELYRLTPRLPELLVSFGESVRAFIAKELG